MKLKSFTNKRFPRLVSCAGKRNKSGTEAWVKFQKIKRGTEGFERVRIGTHYFCCHIENLGVKERVNSSRL